MNTDVVSRSRSLGRPAGQHPGTPGKHRGRPGDRYPSAPGRHRRTAEAPQAISQAETKAAS
jgi:hypothetical protein